MEESVDSCEIYSFEKEASFSPSHISRAAMHETSPRKYVSSYVLYDSKAPSQTVLSDDLNWEREDKET